MASEQYVTGSVTIVTGSTILYGSNTQWNNGTVQEGHAFKISSDGAKLYTIATVLSATRLQLSSAYREASISNSDYIITRSFSPYRSYARLYRGDSYAADVLREQVIDLLDKDVGRIYNGVASLDGTRLVSANGSHYWDIDVTASGQMTFSYMGVKKAYVATITGSWVTV